MLPACRVLRVPPPRFWGCWGGVRVGSKRSERCSSSGARLAPGGDPEAAGPQPGSLEGRDPRGLSRALLCPLLPRRFPLGPGARGRPSPARPALPEPAQRGRGAESCGGSPAGRGQQPGCHREKQGWQGLRARWLQAGTRCCSTGISSRHCRHKSVP